jgi:hypothetical protein
MSQRLAERQRHQARVMWSMPERMHELVRRDQRGVAGAGVPLGFMSSTLPGGMRFDGVEFLRADTHRGWGIASMARAAARWAHFS